MIKSIKIGTRSSKLALYQSNLVKEKLSSLLPSIKISLVEIKTKGDKIQDRNLDRSIDKGFFVNKEALAKIKEALKLDKNLTVQAHYRFGEVYTKLKDTRKAIKHYKEAISVDPSAAMPNLRLGMLYYK